MISIANVAPLPALELTHKRNISSVSETWMNAEIKIAVLMTCFNRRDTTLHCLDSIRDAVAGSAEYDVVLVDDGSTDGTAEAVKTMFPKTVIVASAGDLYWNRGMRLAWQKSLFLEPDFFLWLNDDTLLRPNAVSDMLIEYQVENYKNTIVVGRTRDPITKETTYGGYKKRGRISKLRFGHLSSDERYCDTMNGNCVLIPAQAVGDIGINSEKYSHAFGDNDYGLRCTKKGYRIVELKDAVADQERNDAYALKNSKLTYKNWRHILFHPKGVPAYEWWNFCHAHGGPLWLVNFLLRYLKMIRLSASN